MGHDATERALVRSMLQLRAHAPFFATLALFAELRPSADVDTAATDGERILYSPAYVARLSPPETLGVLLHEVLHCALEHPARRGLREPLRWNVAADVVVNGIVRRQAWATLPRGAIVRPSLEDLAVEEVYELLDPDASLPLGMRDLVDGPDALDAGRRARVSTHWRHARAQAAALDPEHAGFGSEAGGLVREVRALDERGVDWRAALWRFLVRTPEDFGEYDRRFVHRGLYVESLEQDHLALHLCIDTSGSIQDALLAAFLGEVRALARMYPSMSGSLYFADAGLDGPHPLAAEPPRPRGGGGTSFVPFFDAIAAERARLENPHAPPAVAVYLTDGEGEFPLRPPPVEVLWVVPPGGAREETFPFGTVLRCRCAV